MHHWTFSCFIADGFRGPSAHSNVFNKPPSPSPRGLEAAGYSFSTPGAYSSFPRWEKKAAVFLPALGGRHWTIEEAWCVSQIRERAPGFQDFVNISEGCVSPPMSLSLSFLCLCVYVSVCLFVSVCLSPLSLFLSPSCVWMKWEEPASPSSCHTLPACCRALSAMIDSIPLQL